MFCAKGEGEAWKSAVPFGSDSPLPCRWIDISCIGRQMALVLAAVFYGGLVSLFRRHYFRHQQIDFVTAEDEQKEGMGTKKLIRVSPSGLPFGFKLTQNVLTDARIDQLLKQLQSPAIVVNGFMQLSASPNLPIWEFGWNFSSSGATAPNRKLQMEHKLGEVPPFLCKLWAELRQKKLVPQENVPDHCMVNCYKGGIGLFQHVDALDFWGPWIVVLSCGASSILRLRHIFSTHVFFDVVIPSGALYVLQSDARYEWSHEILASKTPSVAQPARYAIIWRNVLPALIPSK